MAHPNANSPAGIAWGRNAPKSSLQRAPSGRLLDRRGYMRYQEASGIREVHEQPSGHFICGYELHGQLWIQCFVELELVPKMP
jgi:hypothetical protein